ncbi:MAG: hypothetical protein CSA62_02790 [Planctomycetota bacterium]|nr:MAG: hypothetical protein CSA62_02790 [Planctomycetota bacterium]
MACAWLEHAFAALPLEAGVELEGTWMLSSLLLANGERIQALAREGRLACVPRYCRESVHTPYQLRRANLELGLRQLEAWPGIRHLEPGPEAAQLASLHDKAGLCCEQQRIVDVIAEALRGSDRAPEAMLRQLLPAISPAGLGGFGNALSETHALALLESAFAALGLEEEALELPQSGTLPRRVGELRLEHPRLQLRWRRKHGLCWAASGLRESSFLASLEVQGDGGGRQGFVPTHPLRPRYFEAAHSRPVLHNAKVGVLQLRRSVSLPVDAHAPRGRHQVLDLALSLRLDQQRQDEAVLELELELASLVAGHRYRLALPVPFWPRPGVYPRPSRSEQPELCSQEGPQPPTAVLGTCSLASRDTVLIVNGPGLREVELLPRKNDQLLMLTLARCPEGEAAPSRLRRRFRLIWRSAGTLDGRPG